MPIKVQKDLPARAVLEEENIFIMDEDRALSQDIRPLEILILNLMPLKEETETQLLRALSNTPLQVDCTFLMMSSHVSKNTSASHLNKFYVEFADVKRKKYDGMIITGAPVELLEYEEVNYWPELSAIMEWSKIHVTSTLHICWGAQAGLYFHHGIEKRSLPRKLFGVYEHRVLKPSSPLFRGFDDVFCAPHSRYTEVWEKDIRAAPELELLATSSEAGVYAVKTEDSSQFFIMGHPEYDPDTLAREYRRDIDKGLDIAVPAHYFPEDDPARVPVVRWRSAGQLLYTNWLNYYVYQTTPYDLNKLLRD